MRETGSGITPKNLVTLLNNEVKKKSLNSISKATGVGISALHRYQRGIGEPTSATLDKLAIYFKVSVTWLRDDYEFSVSFKQEQRFYMADFENKKWLDKLISTARFLDLDRLKLLNERADELLKDWVAEEAEFFDPDLVYADEE